VRQQGLGIRDLYAPEHRVPAGGHRLHRRTEQNISGRDGELEGDTLVFDVVGRLYSGPQHHLLGSREDPVLRAGGRVDGKVQRQSRPQGGDDRSRLHRRCRRSCPEIDILRHPGDLDADRVVEGILFRSDQKKSVNIARLAERHIERAFRISLSKAILVARRQGESILPVPHGRGTEVDQGDHHPEFLTRCQDGILAGRAGKAEVDARRILNAHGRERIHRPHRLTYLRSQGGSYGFGGEDLGAESLAHLAQRGIPAVIRDDSKLGSPGATLVYGRNDQQGLDDAGIALRRKTDPDRIHTGEFAGLRFHRQDELAAAIDQGHILIVVGAGGTHQGLIDAHPGGARHFQGGAPGGADLVRRRNTLVQIHRLELHPHLSISGDVPDPGDDIEQRIL